MFCCDVPGLAAGPASSFTVLPVRLAPRATSIHTPSPAPTPVFSQHYGQHRSAGHAGHTSGRSKVATAAAHSLNAGGGFPQDDDSRRRAVLKFVRDVSPNEVQAFIEESPPAVGRVAQLTSLLQAMPAAVVAAFKQTVANMVGTLPPQHFSVTIDTVADSLATLMQTMLRTGYLLRNVQYQLDLELALRNAAASMSAPEDVPGQHGAHTDSLTGSTATSYSLPGAMSAAIEPEIVTSTTSDDESSGALAFAQSASGLAAASVGGWAYPEENYAPGVQTSKVQGEVMRWHKDNGVERMAAQQYIQLLEARVQALEQQLAMQPPRTASLPGASTPHLALPQPNEPTFNLATSTSVASEALSQSHAGPTVAAAAAATAAAAAAIGGYTLAGAQATHTSTDLLSYLRTLDSSALAHLAECGQDVADAMHAFVARLMGTAEREQLRAMTSEFTAVELSKLLFWVLVVGWSLRALEVRCELEEGFEPPEPLSAALYSGADNGGSQTGIWGLPDW